MLVCMSAFRDVREAIDGRERSAAGSVSSSPSTSSLMAAPIARSRMSSHTARLREPARNLTEVLFLRPYHAVTNLLRRSLTLKGGMSRTAASQNTWRSGE